MKLLRLSSITVAAAVIQVQCGYLSAPSNVSLESLYGPGLSPGAEIYYASDANFSQEVLPRFYALGPPTFYGAIKPATEVDVAHIVNVSVANNIPFLATGGGHSGSATLSRLQQGIDIDLGNFKAFSLDLESNLLTVGGATTYADVIPALYDAGKQLPMPNNPCPGVVGAALGGGVGIYQGLYGLTLDALVSVRLITSQGQIIEASETENPDLFWGLRGAGFNFGIVTSATFHVYDAPNNGSIVSADFLFPGSANGSVWEALASFDDSIPDELVFNILVTYDSSTGGSQIIVDAIYLGTKEEAQPYLDVFTALGPVASDLVETPWPNITNVAFFGGSASSADCSIHDQYVNAYTIGLAQTDVPTFISFFNNITNFWQSYSEYSSYMLIERMSTAVLQSVPDSSTAYGHRNFKTQLLFENSYANTTSGEPVDAFMRQTRAGFQVTSGLDELQVYVNYAHGDEGPRAWYSPAKLPGLSALKKRYDPLQVFSWNNPVPAEYTS